VISTESITSPNCKKEIAHAVSSEPLPFLFSSTYLCF
jgi:hypothetical protein